MAVSLGVLKERLTELMGNNSTFWTDEEKRDAINEAICMWQVLTGEWLEQAWEIPLSPSSGKYIPIPRQLLSPTRVGFRAASGSGAFSPLSLTSLPEVDFGMTGLTDSLDPNTPIYWGPNGIGEIFIVPAPLSGVLRVEGYSADPRLFSDGDELVLGEDETVPFLLFAHHVCSFKEGGAEFGATQDELKEFVNEAVERNDVLTTTQFYRKALGLVKEESERPAREGLQEYGVRGTQGGKGGV